MTLSEHPGDHHSSLSSLIFEGPKVGDTPMDSQLTATNLGRLDGQGC